MNIKECFAKFFKKKRNNPFGTLKSIYDEGVKDGDKAGYAETFKKCSDTLFAELNQYVVAFAAEDKCFSAEPLHVIDVEYLDGYFIFGFGTNSVVHFHIKECPGWKFGVWWSAPDYKQDIKDTEKRIPGQFFAQYEETLDKFKPSRSEICCSIDAYPFGTEPYCDCWKATEYITFIRLEPALAFCRDYFRWDYNTAFHSREEAQNAFEAYKSNKAKKDKVTEILDDKLLGFVNEKIAPLFSGAEIVDQGDCCAPRYELRAPVNQNKDMVKKPGCYGWFAEGDEEGQKILAEFRAIEKECCKEADAQGIMWFRPIDECIIFTRDTK